MTQEGLPKHVLLPDEPDTVLNVYDVSSYGKKDKQQAIQQRIEENAYAPFDLTRLPLFRFSLIQTDTERYLLILNIHHIVVDGYSAQLRM